MKTEMIKLLKVKSIVTIMLTVIFCGLSWREAISGEQFLHIFTTVIAFYFGTQAEKNEQKSEREE